MRWRVPSLAFLAGLSGCAGLGPPLYDSMTDSDVTHASRTVQRALEKAPDGGLAAWSDPSSGNAGKVRPVRTFLTADGRVCRDYEEDLLIDRRRAIYRNTACRTDDGHWVWL